MRVERKRINFVVSSNYHPRVFKRAVPLSLVRALLVLLGLLVVALVVALVLAGSAAYRLARLSYLEQRNAQLEEEFARVSLLKERIEKLEAQQLRYAEMLGIELSPPPVDWSSAPGESVVVPDWTAEADRPSRPVPVLVPLDDYAVSRRFTSEHRGVDLAASAGLAVHASGDGYVLGRGEDSVFGRFILLEHHQGFQTYYGHLQDWRVEPGDSVRAGHVVGSVGSTGRSSAPHLHFEVRRYGEPVDPEESIRLE
jgi:murein DD-endopeptidase MepM/ murein hydrolase activator NlpD